MTNTYSNRTRTGLSLAQPTSRWTNGLGYDLPREIKPCHRRRSPGTQTVIARNPQPGLDYLTGRAKRLTKVTSPAGTFSYQFAGAGPSTLVARIGLPNTSYIANTYDTMARLKGTYLRTSSHVLTNKHEYNYDSGSQRTQQTFMDAATYGYTYDRIGQLTNADSSVPAQDRKYVFDAAWNLNFRTNNTTVHTFKVVGKNQLTNATPVGTRTYDANGNVTWSAGAKHAYSYEDKNQLQNWYFYSNGANGNGSPTSTADLRTEFIYDGKGRLRKRVEYTVTGASVMVWTVALETRSVYDGRRVIQERSEANRKGKGSPISNSASCWAASKV